MKYWLTVTAPCDMVSNTTPDIWFNASSQLFNLNHCVHSNVGYDQPVTDRHHYHTRPEALVAQQGLQRLVTKAATSIQINNSWCCAVVGFLVFLLCLYPRAKKSVYIIKKTSMYISHIIICESILHQIAKYIAFPAHVFLAGADWYKRQCLTATKVASMCPTDAYTNMLSKKNMKILVLIFFSIWKQLMPREAKDGPSRMKQLDVVILTSMSKQTDSFFSTEDGTGYGYGWKVLEKKHDQTTPYPCLISTNHVGVQFLCFLFVKSSSSSSFHCKLGLLTELGNALNEWCGHVFVIPPELRPLSGAIRSHSKAMDRRTY